MIPPVQPAEPLSLGDSSQPFTLPAFSMGDIRRSFSHGTDMLGDWFMATFSKQERRASGSTYTPMRVVSQMLELVAGYDADVVIDCGCGSGRFAIAASQMFPHATVYAIDSSPLACQLCRANVEASGLSSRIEVVQGDFLAFDAQAIRKDGQKILWLGNPPYVRHHAIDEHSKKWLSHSSRSLGIAASGLSGLHAYFLAKIALQWHPGDLGVLVTSAEWLTVKYGSFMRELLSSRLCIDDLILFDATERLFEDADTTATIFSFGLDTEQVRVSAGGRTCDIPRSTLVDSPRWDRLLEGPAEPMRDGFVRLGDIARVHRGVVTGDNGFWVRKPEQCGSIPDSLRTPIVAHARELKGDCIAQTNPNQLSQLITIPSDLSVLSKNDARAAQAIIDEGLRRGVDKGYVASRRKPWWSVRLPKRPAIMMTYMSREEPTFIRNSNNLAMLNVVHGIYPLKPLPVDVLDRLTAYLNEHVGKELGRTYSGGLTKFEPREVENIPVPSLEQLEAAAS